MDNTNGWNNAQNVDVTINAGGLTLKDESLIFRSVNIGTGATFTVDTTKTESMSNLTGTGTFIKNNAGTYTVNDARSFTGTTTVNEGLLAYGVYQAGGDILNNAAVRFNNGNNATYSGVISGTGSVDWRGGNFLANVQTYTGNTINRGNLRIDAGGGLSDSSTYQGISGQLQFNVADGYVYGANITGNSDLNFLANSNTTLTGNNTGTGNWAFIQRDATVNIGDGGTTGGLNMAAGLQVWNGAALTFNRSDNFDFTSDMYQVEGSTKTITQNGTGTVNFTMDNTNGWNNAQNIRVQLNQGTIKLGSSTALNGAISYNFNGGSLGYSAANKRDNSAKFVRGDGVTYSVDVAGQAVSLAATSLTGELSNLEVLDTVGGGTLTVSASNTYTGDTFLVDSGQGVASIVGDINDTTPITKTTTVGADLAAEAVIAEGARVEAARVEAARVEAARVEAARVEAERVEAARVEAARVEAEKSKSPTLDKRIKASDIKGGVFTRYINESKVDLKAIVDNQKIELKDLVPTVDVGQVNLGQETPSGSIRMSDNLIKQKENSQETSNSITKAGFDDILVSDECEPTQVC